jgi:hypothetical protein
MTKKQRENQKKIEKEKQIKELLRQVQEERLQEHRKAQTEAKLQDLVQKDLKKMSKQDVSSAIMKGLILLLPCSLFLSFLSA